MNFGSLIFLGWFLPFLFAIYFLTPNKGRNAILLVFNIIFLAYCSISAPETLLLTGLTIGFNYAIGVGLIKAPTRGLKKALLLSGILVHVGILFILKYLGFVLRVTGNKDVLQLVAPVGLSFYTFQAISYLVDIYKGKTKGTLNIVRYLNYMLLFPQFVSGPIVRFDTVSKQLKERTITVGQFFQGLEKFIIGLTMKTVIADQLGHLWFRVGAIGYESISTPLAWIGIVGYSVELYLDFGGYSLMAIGLGECLGFTLPENFRYPYESVSMSEFWGRWHITLGTWFRDYIYIPLGGNRKGMPRTIFNLFVVWLLTGIWHGASWNFLVWGLFLFLIIANEKLWLKKFLDSKRVFGHIYMILLIPLSWMIFAIENFGDLLIYAKRLVGIGGVFIYENDIYKLLTQYGVFVVVGLFLCTHFPRKVYEKIENKIIRGILLAGMLAGSVYMIYLGMNNPFMYFKF